MSYPGVTVKRCHVCKAKEEGGIAVLTKIPVGPYTLIQLCGHCYGEYRQRRYLSENQIIKEMKAKVFVCKSQLQINETYEFHTSEGTRRGKLLFLGEKNLVYAYYDINRDENIEVWSDYSYWGFPDRYPRRDPQIISRHMGHITRVKE